MMAVFSLVILVVWFIRRFSFDYAFEISLGAGVMVNILGFLIADLKYDVTVSIGTLIVMSLVSGVIAMLCDYMKRVLDYTAVERVQFEAACQGCGEYPALRDRETQTFGIASSHYQSHDYRCGFVESENQGRNGNQPRYRHHHHLRLHLIPRVFQGVCHLGCHLAILRRLATKHHLRHHRNLFPGKSAKIISKFFCVFQKISYFSEKFGVLCISL